MKGNTTKQWLRPYQLAKKKEVSTQTIYRFIREGKLEARKVKIIVERLEVLDK